MKEHTRKVVDVLGIDVSVMRPDKAVNITMNYMNRKEVSSIYFHTALSSLFCQSNEWAASCLDSCNLVLAGDRYMELALAHTASQENETSGSSLFADAYLKRLLTRLNRDAKEIFVVLSQEEHFQSLKEYMHSSYPDIVVEGAVFDEKSAGDMERIINEINGMIPDIVFICLSAKSQLEFLQDSKAMMNTHLIICIESLRPLIVTETEMIPGWVQKLHLTGFYHWIKKEGKLQEQIIGSIFRKTVRDESENTEDENHL